jgi:hypothetical protein
VIVAAFVLRVLAALLGLVLGWRLLSYRLMANWLVALLVLSSARWASTWPARGPKPYEGAGRRWWSLEQGTTVAFYLAVVLAVWWVLREQKPVAKWGVGVVLGVFALGGLTLAAWLAYPMIRGPLAPKVLTSIAWASGAVQITALFRFVTRQPRPTLTPAALTAWALAISGVLSAAGPYLFGHPDRDWALAPWIGIGTWIVVLALQLSALRRVEGASHG